MSVLEAPQMPVSDRDHRHHRAAAARRTPWRFALRLARRETARRRWQTFLVVVLIAVPTMIVMLGAIVFRTGQAANSWVAVIDADLVIPYLDVPPGVDVEEDENGTMLFDGRNIVASAPIGAFASGEVPGSSKSLAEIQEILPPGWTAANVIYEQTRIETVDGRQLDSWGQHVNLTTMNPADPMFAGAFQLVDGALPRAGEMAVTPLVAHDLGVRSGDTLSLQSPQGDWKISGIVNSAEQYLMVIPGFDESRLVVAAGAVYVDAPDDVDASAIEEVAIETGGTSRASIGEMGLTNADSEPTDSTAVAWLLIVVLFAAFGVIVVAAFATFARSQLVLVGQLSANGATQPLIRRVLAWQGAWAAVLGVTIGMTAAAIVTLLGWTNRLHSVWSGSTPYARIVWKPADVIAVAVVGIITGLLAATVPAVSLSKVSVLSALAGRRPERPVPAWMVPIGIATFMSGLGLLILSVSASAVDVSTATTIGAIIGVVAIAVSVWLTAPLIVQVAARLATNAPLAVRLAFRGLGRARLRSSAMVAAIAITTGGAALLIAGFATSVGRDNPGQPTDRSVLLLSTFSIEVSTPGAPPIDIGALGEQVVSADDAERYLGPIEITTIAGTDPSAQRTEIARILPGAAWAPLRVGVRPNGTYDNSAGVIIETFPASEARVGSEPTPGEVVLQSGLQGELFAPVYIADPQTLRALSYPQSFIDQLDMQGFAFAGPTSSCPNGGVAGPNAPFVADDWGAGLVPAVIPTRGTECGWSTQLLMTERYARDHNVAIMTIGYVANSPTSLTRAQRKAIDAAVYGDGNGYVVASAFSKPADQPTGSPVQRGDSFRREIYAQTGWAPTATDFRVMMAALFGIAFVATLLIAGLGLILSASDSRRDSAVLSVVGARPSTLRRSAAADAWALSSLGAVIGIPLALFAGWAVTTATRQAVPTGVPWLFTIAELVVMPLLLAAVAYLATLLTPKVRPMRYLRAD